MSYLLAVVILLAAAVLRLWDLPHLPLGLHDQEITTIRLVEAARQGNIAVFYDVAGEGREALYPTLVALVTFFTGSGTLGYRLISAFAGMLVLVLVYSLGIRLFGRVAGLAAMALLTVMLLPVLLARVALVEALIPLHVAVVMLSLARALPVYRPELRDENTNTTAFAALGISLGMGYYIYPQSLLVTLAAMLFIAYSIATQRPLSRQRLSYIGFSILMMIIIAIPYLTSSFNLPQLAAGNRALGGYDGLIRSLLAGMGGIFWQGDTNPILNLPHRPLMDVVSAIFVGVGLVVSLRYWQQPRFALLLIFSGVMFGAAVLVAGTPNFLAYTLLVVPLGLAFGLGTRTLIAPMRGLSLWLAALGLALLLVYNLLWTRETAFLQWAQQDTMQSAYHSDLGAIARHLDRTAGRVPSIVCYPAWSNRQDRAEISPAEKTLLMMNRVNANLRYIDCRQGMLFARGGSAEQVILPDQTLDKHQVVRDWLALGTPLDGLPPGAVIRLDVETPLADRAGLYISTASAQYDITATTPNDFVRPPVRFGGNVTWLGYEQIEDNIYQPGDIVTVVNYWRVEGVIPTDLLLFTHILSDPLTVIAQSDTIIANPRQLQERDVFVQVNYVLLPEKILPGEYDLSIGAYRRDSDQRLDVFDPEQRVRGDRLFIYPIRVEEP